MFLAFYIGLQILPIIPEHGFFFLSIRLGTAETIPFGNVLATIIDIYIYLDDSILEHSCEHTAQDKDAYRHYHAFSSSFTRPATRSILHVALMIVT